MKFETIVGVLTSRVIDECGCYVHPNGRPYPSALWNGKRKTAGTAANIKDSLVISNAGEIKKRLG